MVCNPRYKAHEEQVGEEKEPDNASRETNEKKAVTAPSIGMNINTTAESRHEPDNASRETKLHSCCCGVTLRKHPPPVLTPSGSGASRETKLQQPSQGTSPTTPQEKFYTAACPGTKADVKGYPSDR